MSEPTEPATIGINRPRSKRGLLVITLVIITLVIAGLIIFFTVTSNLRISVINASYIAAAEKMTTETGSKPVFQGPVVHRVMATDIGGSDYDKHDYQVVYKGVYKQVIANVLRNLYYQQDMNCTPYVGDKNISLDTQQPLATYKYAANQKPDAYGNARGAKIAYCFFDLGKYNKDHGTNYTLDDNSAQFPPSYTFYNTSYRGQTATLVYLD